MITMNVQCVVVQEILEHWILDIAVCILIYTGDMDSGPVFLRRSLDECVYEFEWQTAAACVLSRETGSGCKVYNEDLGKSPDGSSVNTLCCILCL